MDDLIRQTLDKVDKVLEGVQSIELKMGIMETQVNERLKHGNDRFDLIEKRLELAEKQHHDCIIRSDIGIRFGLDVLKHHAGDFEEMAKEWVAKKELLQQGKKNAVGEIIKIVVTIISTVMVAGIIYIITKGKLP